MYYVYVDWTTEEFPRPFYVGKGNFNRTKDWVEIFFMDELQKSMV